MKKEFITIVLMVLALMSRAQNGGQGVTLHEVQVKSARVINKDDGQAIFPTSEQKGHSTTGFSLLKKLALPNIRVDEVEHSIAAVDGRGEVQIRINGIIAGKSELMSLNPATVVKVDFIDNPGLRYGKDVAYVINIHTRRGNTGYAVGADLTQAVTTKFGDDNLYAKWHAGKSQFSASYNFSYKDFDGNRLREKADYTLNDGSQYTIERNDVASRSSMTDHTVKLSYNWTDSTLSVFQASLSGNFFRQPHNWHERNVAEGNNGYMTVLDRQSDRSASPVLDIYFFKKLAARQSLTLNAVGTYIDSKASAYFDEGMPYRYDVKGKTYSLMSEAVYENKLKPFTLNAGLTHKYKYTENEYSGDVSSLNIMHNHRLYGFAELKGHVNKLHYSGGVGTSWLGYRQHEHRYNYWLFRPKATLAYHFSDAVQIRYDWQVYDAVSKIAMISNVGIRTNSMEQMVGSPDLKPSRDMEHNLKLSYNRQRMQSFLECFYKSCHHPNMAAYSRTADNQFIYTQRNQKEIDALHVMASADYWLVPDILSLNAQGGLFRCFNFGDDYTHCYTSWFYQCSATAYLGAFTLSGYIDNGTRFLEGEKRGYNGSYAVLSGAYQYKDWQFSLRWRQPFARSYKMMETEIINRDMHKLLALYGKDICNWLSVNVAWKINGGGKYKSPHRQINMSDRDTGILKR